MRQFFFSVFALAFGLVLGSTAHAGGKSTGSPSSSSRSHPSHSYSGYSYSSYGYSSYRSGSNYGGSHNHYPNYHIRFGTPFNYGYYYSGRDHYHWSKFYWNSKYGCYFYFCPYTSCYYYWYEPSGRYYPVRYIEYATPMVLPEPRANVGGGAAAGATP